MFTNMNSDLQSTSSSLVRQRLQAGRVVSWLSPVSSPMSLTLAHKVSVLFSRRRSSLVCLSKVRLWDDRVTDGARNSPDRCKLDSVLPKSVTNAGQGGWVSFFLLPSEMMFPFTTSFSTRLYSLQPHTGTQMGLFSLLIEGYVGGMILTFKYCVRYWIQGCWESARDLWLTGPEPVFICFINKTPLLASSCLGCSFDGLGL